MFCSPQKNDEITSVDISGFTRSENSIPKFQKKKKTKKNLTRYKKLQFIC